MLIFKGFSLNVVNQCFPDEVKKENKPHPWLSIFAPEKGRYILLFLICVLAIFTMIAIATDVIIIKGICFVLIFFFLLFCVGYIVYPLININERGLDKKYRKLKKEIHKPYEVIIEDDGTIIVNIQKQQRAHITYVDSIEVMQSQCILMIYGEITTPMGVVHEFPINLALYRMDILLAYFQLNKKQRTALQFQNETLKKDMHMSEEEREIHFLNDFIQSDFLLPCTLNKDIGLPIKTADGITVYVPNQQSTIAVFTSQEEIKDNLIMYPLRIVISLQELVRQCCEDEENPIFSKNMVDYLKINPYCEGIQFAMSDVWKWLTNMQEDLTQDNA